MRVVGTLSFLAFSLTLISTCFLVSCKSRRFDAPSNPMIVGGDGISRFAKKDAVLPFVAALSTERGVAFCTGTFVSKHVVMTAAHCFMGRRPPDVVKVTLGESSGGNGKGFTAKPPYFSHPAFGGGNSNEVYGDIALIKIQEDDAGIKPATLAGPNTRLEFGTELTHLGYGTSLDKDEDQQNLPLNFVAASYADLLPPTGEFMTRFTSLRGVCNGDSGGPVLKADDLSVVGIVSQGLDQDCALSSGFFTDVKTYRPYIDCIVDAFESGEVKEADKVNSTCARKVKVADIDSSLLRIPFRSNESEAKDLPMIAFLAADDAKPLCTGVALSPKRVLTSAYCLGFGKNLGNFVAAWNYGSGDIPKFKDAIAIESFAMPPGADDVAYFNANDVALVTLKTPLPANVAFPRFASSGFVLPEADATDTGFFVGLGRIDETPTPAFRMGLAKPRLHGTEAAGAPGMILIGPSWRRGLHLEADAGAPLFVKHSDGEITLVGVASKTALKRPTAGARSIGAFVDLRPLEGWLQTQLK